MRALVRSRARFFQYESLEPGMVARRSISSPHSLTIMVHQEKLLSAVGGDRIVATAIVVQHTPAWRSQSAGRMPFACSRQRVSVGAPCCCQRLLRSNWWLPPEAGKFAGVSIGGYHGAWFSPTAEFGWSSVTGTRHAAGSSMFHSAWAPLIVIY